MKRSDIVYWAKVTAGSVVGAVMLYGFLVVALSIGIAFEGP
jgi:hypothetical protein